MSQDSPTIRAANKSEKLIPLNEKEMFCDPGVAVMKGLPDAVGSHVVTTLAGLATDTPAGSVCAKEIDPIRPAEMFAIE